MLEALPAQVQADARAGFEKWKQDPQSVGWKKVAGMRAEVHSVEIGLRWRALGVVSKEHDAVVWVFAGSHETYNNYISSHRKMSQGAWIKPDPQKRLEVRRDNEAANNQGHQPVRRAP
jgi:hypothetical protein